MEGFDPGAMVEIVRGGAIEHTQLAPGHFVGHVLSARDARLCVDWGRYNLPVLAEGTFSRDALTLGFLLHDEGSAIFNGRSVPPDSVVLFSEGHEVTLSMPHRCNWVSVQVPRERLCDLGFEPRPGAFEVWPLAAPVARALKGTALPAFETLQGLSPHGRPSAAGDHAQALADLEDGAIAALSTTLERVEPRGRGLSRPPRGGRYRVARAAAEYMNDQLELPMTISEVCSAVGASYRTLERAFVQTYGLGPKRYLTHRRLSRLRLLLKAGHGGALGVTDLFLECGLTHFGRAAEGYRRLFGETPSMTASSGGCAVAEIG